MFTKFTLPTSCGQSTRINKVTTFPLFFQWELVIHFTQTVSPNKCLLVDIALAAGYSNKYISNIGQDACIYLICSILVWIKKIRLVFDINLCVICSLFLAIDPLT